MLLHPYSLKKYIKLSLPPVPNRSFGRFRPPMERKRKIFPILGFFLTFTPGEPRRKKNSATAFRPKNRANPQEHLRLLPGRIRPDEPPRANALGDHPGQSSHPVPCPESFLFPGLSRPAVRYPGAKDAVRAGGFERTRQVTIPNTFSLRWNT